MTVGVISENSNKGKDLFQKKSKRILNDATQFTTQLHATLELLTNKNPEVHHITLTTRHYLALTC